MSNNSSSQIKKPFWDRQFEERVTSGQRKFDWIFGIVMPAICFLFDPIVFKGSLNGGAIFAKYKPFAYVLSYISIMALFAFLKLGKRAKYFNAFFAGIFLVGGLVSLIVGVILIPFSLIGLLMIIGVLGFTPLFTAFVFLRNSFRAFQIAKPFLDAKKLLGAFALTTILSFGFPLVLNIQMERILSAVENGDAATIQANSRTLRMFAPIINPDRLVREFGNIQYSLVNKTGIEQISLSERQTAIAELYYGITGEDISTKSRMMD